MQSCPSIGHWRQRSANGDSFQRHLLLDRAPAGAGQSSRARAGEIPLRSGDAYWRLPARLDCRLRRTREAGAAPVRAGTLELEINPQVWQEAYALVRRARSAALPCPSPRQTDRACARHHGAELESRRPPLRDTKDRLRPSRRLTDPVLVSEIFHLRSPTVVLFPPVSVRLL